MSNKLRSACMVLCFVALGSLCVSPRAGDAFDPRLTNTTVVPGSYGDGTHIAAITVDPQGRITTASAVVITGAAPTGAAGGALAGTYPNPTLAPITNITPGANFTLTQNGVASFTTVESGAIASTIYLSAGKVGIGMNAPNFPVELWTNDGNNQLTAALTDAGGKAGLLGLTAANGGNAGAGGGILFGGNAAGQYFGAIKGLLGNGASNTTGDIAFSSRRAAGDTALTENMRIQGTTGVVTMPGLGASSAATTGTVCWTTGTGLLNVDTTTTCLLSTRRIKENIHDLPRMMDTVMALRPVSYTLRPESNPGKLGPQIGLIAEEVNAVDPRLVSVGQDGLPMGVRYLQLTAVLVKAIQGQQQQLQELTARIERLEAYVASRATQ